MSERGAALLVVLGATAGLTVLTAMLLLVSLTAYEVAGVRHERAQAQALAEGALAQLRVELAGGRLQLPAGDGQLRITNGRSHDGSSVPVAVFPAAPAAAHWPPAGDEASFATETFGAVVVLERRLTPDGEPVAGPAPDTWLLQVSVAAWFRRGRWDLQETLAAAPPRP